MELHHGWLYSHESCMDWQFGLCLVATIIEMVKNGDGVYLLGDSDFIDIDISMIFI